MVVEERDSSALNTAGSNGALAPKLSFERVTKGFPGARGWTPAIQDFSLRIQPGEFVCIVGPSGCGKTTVLNLAAGFIQPDLGEVLLGGQPIKEPGPDRAVIFQENALFPWLTVRKNTELGMELAGKPKQERRVVADFYLKMVNLHKFENSLVHELSGGMRQRVQLARALCLMPSVFLMDEPFAALDAITRDFLYEEIQHLVAETKQTVLFITHNVREAAILGDRIVIMGGAQPGRIKAEFPVNLPRPRNFESPGIVELLGKTMQLLKDEGSGGAEPGNGNGN